MGLPGLGFASLLQTPLDVEPAEFVEHRRRLALQRVGFAGEGGDAFAGRLLGLGRLGCTDEIRRLGRPVGPDGTVGPLEAR